MSSYHKVQTKLVFCLFFFKLRFSTFFSKSAKQVVFLLACDLILRLEEVLICLLKHKPKENLAFWFITGLDFRLLTVQTSHQNRISEERPGNTVSRWVVWCLDTVSFHRRVTFQAGRCFPFSKNACEMHDSSCYCEQPKKFRRVQGRTNHIESNISDTCWASFSHSGPEEVGVEGPCFHS